MVDRHYRVLVATMRITTNTTPKTTTGDLSEYWLNHLVVVIAAGKRPASIPNLEAKPASADGTAPGRVWESRTPPQQTFTSGWGPEHDRPSPTRSFIRGTRAYTTTLSLRASTTQPHTQPFVSAVIAATQIPDDL